MDRRLLTDHHALRIVGAGRDGKPYRPSNGTEGDMFMERYCYDCVNRLEDEQGTLGCPILERSLLHDVDEPGYPAEWQFGPDGQPTCTAFRPEEVP